MKKLMKNNSGITFVEVLVSLFVVTLGITSSLLYMTTAKAATELAKERTTATTHAESIFEEMKTRSTLANITGTNWTTFWQSFVTANTISTLPSETLTITYTNAVADPLAITVAVNWTQNARAQNVTLQTEMTK